MGTIGIEWVNEYHGNSSDLSNNDNNAEGFYNTLDGVKQFAYGNDLAWDQDFEQSGVGAPAGGTDTTYADDVDIVYFSGHGSSAGPSFGVRNHDDGRARHTEMQLGDRDLEWIIFDACQVLARRGGDVFQDWGWPVFHGLHIMLGFDTDCYDVKSRGEKFASSLNSGRTVIESWIRACRETEDSSTFYAYLYANDASSDTQNDHWWGKGHVSSDPKKPTSLTHGRGPC